MCQCETTICTYPDCRVGRAIFDKQTPAEKYNDWAGMRADITNGELEKLRRLVCVQATPNPSGSV